MLIEEFLVCFLTITFRVQLENTGCIYRHRTVYVNRDFWNPLLFYKQVEIVNQFLSTFNCK